METGRYTPQGALTAQNKADITKYSLTALGAGVGAWAGYALANKFTKSKPLFMIVGALVAGAGVFTFGHFTIKESTFARDVNPNTQRRGDVNPNTQRWTQAHVDCNNAGWDWNPSAKPPCRNLPT